MRKCDAVPYPAICVLSLILGVDCTEDLTRCNARRGNSGLRSLLNQMRCDGRHLDTLPCNSEGLSSLTCLLERECGLVARVVLGTSQD